MSKEYQLTKEEKQSAIRLAHLIYERDVREDVLLECLEQDKVNAKIVMDFWSKHNEITKLALNKVICIKCKKHLESCFKLEYKGTER